MKRRFQLSVILTAVCTLLMAQPPAGYYDNAFGKKERTLKTALYDIIKDHTVKDYGFLYTIYETSDVTDSGKVWDMYSTCTWTPGQKKCGNQSKVCDCYNREHSVPSSWFSDKSPMVSDAFHIYPTDGRVNNFRGNMPFGECESGKIVDNDSRSLARIGNSTFPGYSGKVFEPDDEYKGDFARSYFYFATRYENIMTSIAGDSFNKTVYPAFSSWARAMFLKWHRQDPVSQKEVDRNNAIFQYQENRNPFIDYPQLAEYIWGDSITYVFDPNAAPNQLEEIKVTPPVLYVSDGTLHIENSSEGTIVQLFNVYGQLIVKTQLSSGIYTVPLSGDRIYIVRITGRSGSTWAYKIINDR